MSNNMKNKYISTGGELARQTYKAIQTCGVTSNRNLQQSHKLGRRQQTWWINNFVALANEIENRHLVLPNKNEDDALRFMISEWTQEVTVVTRSGETKKRLAAKQGSLYTPDELTLEVIASVANEFEKPYEGL